MPFEGGAVRNSRPSASVTNHQRAKVRIEPARRDRIASTIVMLLESRQIVLRIGERGRLWGMDRSGFCPGRRCRRRRKIEKNTDSVRISARTPTRPRRGRLSLHGFTGAEIVLGAAAIKRMLRFIRTSSRDLPGASDPIADGGFAPSGVRRNCIPAVERSWTIRASTHPRDRCRPDRRNGASVQH